jgi:hypothetical protein
VTDTGRTAGASEATDPDVIRVLIAEDMHLIRGALVALLSLLVLFEVVSDV